MGISLYTTRLVLAALGVVDFGIYNIVAGVVSMLSFLNSAMVQASQRYLSFAQSQGDLKTQNLNFSTTILIHATIAIFVLILLETLGLWYVRNKVVLPQDRYFAANVVYQISILIFISKILVVPYTASVIAHERMDIYAYISIIDYILQLGMVIMLKHMSGDKLIFYAFLMLLVSSIHYLLYYFYTKRMFVECSFKWTKNLTLYKEMFSFAGWAFIGSAGYVARNQGVNLVINLFCGPVVNAARGVAYQVTAAIQTLVSSFQQAINPQIVKRYAEGDIESMMLLVRAGSKYSFLLLLICFVPILVRPSFLLHVWLGYVPEYAPGFLIMGISMALITSMGGPLNTAMQATGDIKLFQIVVSIIMFCDIPFAYYFLNLGIEPYLVTGVSIFTSILCLFAKLLILRRQIRYNLGGFLLNVVFKNICVGATIIIIFTYINKIIPQTFLGFVVLCLLSLVFTSILIYCIALDSNERSICVALLNKIIRK